MESAVDNAAPSPISGSFGTSCQKITQPWSNLDLTDLATEPQVQKPEKAIFSRLQPSMRRIIKGINPRCGEWSKNALRLREDRRSGSHSGNNTGCFGSAQVPLRSKSPCCGSIIRAAIRSMEEDRRCPVHHLPIPARRPRSSRVNSNWRGSRTVGEDFLGFRYTSTAASIRSSVSNSMFSGGRIPCPCIPTTDFRISV